MPPLIVLIKIPPAPQAYPVSLSVNHKAVICCVVPLVNWVQVLPPSAVFKMVPPCPAAKPVDASGKTIENNCAVDDGNIGSDQLCPWLIVLTIFPSLVVLSKPATKIVS